MKRVATSEQLDEELAASILASLATQLPEQEETGGGTSFDVCPLSAPRKKSARHLHAGRQSASPRQVAATRTYIWRGPHRLALKQKQEAHKLLQDTAQQHGLASDADCSSRRSSANSGHSDDDEVAQHHHKQHEEEEEGLESRSVAEPSRQRDKEWAALTTWIRMNLHHPRTAKKLVLFVGEQDAMTGSWRFSLNPGLTWSDLSLETKLRLKMLPLEAEQAFHRKYPNRPMQDWRSKVQKYMPHGAATSVNVSLSEMVTSLNSIFFQHEGAAGSDSSSPLTEQPQKVLAQPVLLQGDGGAAAVPQGSRPGCRVQPAPAVVAAAESSAGALTSAPQPLVAAMPQQQTRLATAVDGLMNQHQAAAAAPGAPAIPAC